MTMLTMFSNSARVIRDRIGRTRDDFENFLNRPDFKRVDRTLLSGFDLKQAGPAAERLIKKIDQQKLFEDGVDWISGLNYEQTRLVEDTIARILVVGSYLGGPEVVFEKQGYENIEQRYQNNNVYQVFLALEKIIDYWPTIKKYYPGDASLIDMIKPFNTALYFLTEKLNSTNDPEKNTTYLALNDLFLAFQTTVFDKLPDPRIIGAEKINLSGFDFVLSLLATPDKLDKSYKVARENFHYLDYLYQNKGEWFLSVGQNLQKLALEPRLDLTPVQSYLNFTTRNAVCIRGEKLCEKNYHYDEMALLTKYLMQKNELGMTNILLVNKKLFTENIDQVIQMVTDIFPAIKIKEIQPPLRI
jgi:hypothetical protein